MSDFRGLRDWIELFRAGTWTDSAGVTRTWTTDDIDQVVANHADDRFGAAPLVIGHPKSSGPAYGWTAELKRDGGSLLGRVDEGTLVPEFEEAVDAGRYRKRSMRLVRTDHGWALEHVGWLGASPPAVSGLKPLEYQAPEAEHHDFESDWYTLDTQAGLWRRIKNWLIGKEGQETAEQIVPEYELDALKEAATEARVQPQGSESTETNPSFSRQEDPMAGNDATFTQADLDAARQAGANEAQTQITDLTRQNEEQQQELETARREGRRADYQALVDQAISEGVPPALLDGAADFAVFLHDEDAEFDFTAADGKEVKGNKPDAWFRDHIKSLSELAKLVPMQPERNGDGPKADFSQQIADYRAKHPGVSAADAAIAVREQAGS